MADEVVEVAVDAAILEKATEVLAASGLTVSDLARLVLTQIANENTLPDYLAPEDPEYDAWFRAKVQEALDDSSPLIPGEDVEREFAERRAALLAQIKAAE